MTNKLRVAVVGGGQNSEHPVSINSAKRVSGALAGEGYDVVDLTITLEGDWLHDEASVGLAGGIDILKTCDVVVPMLHGRNGEDGALAALCDLANLPYVGCDLGSSAAAMDKWVTKLIAIDAGVQTSHGRVVDSVDAAIEWTGPVVVKPATAGSSVGVTIVEEERDLKAALELALEFSPRAIVEQKLTGREIDIPVLGRPDGSIACGPALEIVNEGLFDWDAKYVTGATYLIPAPLSEDELTRLQDSAVKTYQALGCRGLVRIDFFVTDEGPMLIEANTIPGMTPLSQVPRMYESIGTSCGELMAMLVEDAYAESKR